MKKIIATVLVLALAFALCACGGNSQYKQAERLFAAGEYQQAAELYEAAGDYRDSADKAKECRYQLALQAFKRAEYESAAQQFSALGDYKDSADQANECLYQQAIVTFNKGDYKSAKSQFQALKGYSDSANWISRCDQEILNERCGSYNLTGIKIDGKDYTAYINSMGYGDMMITFKSDKTGTMTGSKTNIKFTWNETDITDKSGSYPYTYSGDTIVLTLKNVVLTFTR